MLSVVTPICAATVERRDCTARTPLVVTGAPAVGSVPGCGLEAQSITASMVRLAHGESATIVCRRGGAAKLDEAPGGAAATP